MNIVLSFNVYTEKDFLRKIHGELEPIEINVTHLFTYFTWGVNRLRVFKHFCYIQHSVVRFAGTILYLSIVF